MKMEKGRKISLKELEKQGLRQVGNFAGCYILAKGDERILWDPETKKIELVYFIDR